MYYNKRVILNVVYRIYFYRLVFFTLVLIGDFFVLDVINLFLGEDLVLGLNTVGRWFCGFSLFYKTASCFCWVRVRVL